MPSIISFTTTVTAEDWDKYIGGWRCFSLKIPGAEVDAIYLGGVKVDDGKYKILENHSIIRWMDNSPPSQVLVSLNLTKQLTTKELSNRWKKLAILLPFIAALLVALISNYSTLFSQTKKTDVIAEHISQFQLSDSNIINIDSLVVFKYLPVINNIYERASKNIASKNQQLRNEYIIQNTRLIKLLNLKADIIQKKDVDSVTQKIYKIENN